LLDDLRMVMLEIPVEFYGGGLGSYLVVNDLWRRTRNIINLGLVSNSMNGIESVEASLSYYYQERWAR
jgi:hypothetical protein